MSYINRYEADKWKNAGTLVRIIPERYDKTFQREEKTMPWYYISSSKTGNTGFLMRLSARIGVSKAGSAGCRMLLWEKTLPEKRVKNPP
ncbi:hypothetical protein Barb4_01006 [Bacteroidales bacterium Barb4]|nr:hypothetical protein Barb4_01006 [Bacteroidales bacterium Barb4]